MVGGGWRRAATWPPPHRIQRWRGTSDGNANSRFGDGVLERAEGPPPAQAGPASYLVVEPWVPYPGGPVAGQDESAAEDRRDVLCFTSAPVDRAADHRRLTRGAPVDRRPTGPPTTWWPPSSWSPTDRRASRRGRSAARACDGPPTPRSCGRGRTPGPAPVEHEIELRPTAWRVPAGARLRLDVSGARFPCYDRNPHGPVDAPVVATLAVTAVELDLPLDTHDDATNGDAP